ncbi:MAG: sigma-54-dependent Fis family transcriptional regulator [Planctomycetes bacterium]|nr:sigma-54-dependent Fis family transcriptional regulator [Planctomycetota bacterium]
MKRPSTILLVDDEADFRENVAERLQARGYQILQAGEAESALSIVRENVVDLALVDVLMPGMDGITLLGKLKEIDPLAEVVVVTGQGSIESAVEAMRRGAYHYVTKPVRLAELEMVVRRAVEKTLMSRQNNLLCEERRRTRSRTTAEIVARSSAMRKVLDEAEKLAQTDSSVLIEGETGTGKEVLAEWIHRKSRRSEHPLVVVNCGALSESLVDAELFGHEKGAFTGALESRPGLIEMADGGTLLLDEIGDIAPPAQVRLLRVLERGLFRRVGSTREQSVDVRILAASHRDLTRAAAEGRFREDLYHRLLVFRLRIPPLRERQDDILPLADHFLSRLATGTSRHFGEAARDAMRGYSWPGNVREVAHAVERAAFAAAHAGVDEIEPFHLAMPTSTNSRNPLVSLDEAEKRHVLAVLELMGGNRVKAADVLGISERHLYRLLQRYSGTKSESGTDVEVTGP